MKVIKIEDDVWMELRRLKFNSSASNYSEVLREVFKIPGKGVGKISSSSSSNSLPKKVEGKVVPPSSVMTEEERQEEIAALSEPISLRQIEEATDWGS